MQIFYRHTMSQMRKNFKVMTLKNNNNKELRKRFSDILSLVILLVLKFTLILMQAEIQLS